MTFSGGLLSFRSLYFFIRKPSSFVFWSEVWIRPTNEKWHKILQVPPSLALELLRIIKPAAGPTLAFSFPFSFHSDQVRQNLDSLFTDRVWGITSTMNKQEILKYKGGIKGWSHKNTTILNTVIEKSVNSNYDLKFLLPSRNKEAKRAVG